MILKHLNLKDFSKKNNLFLLSRKHTIIVNSLPLKFLKNGRKACSGISKIFHLSRITVNN